MAGDWIKMRVWLAKDPKVIAISQALAFDRAFMDWLTDPVQRRCDKSALEHVTLECVTRIVTCALLQVWGVANERGKPRENDLILRFASVTTVDEISGLPGLGDAMVSVDWLRFSQEEEIITFPDFMTYNIPFEDRKREKDRERQRRHRAKKPCDNGVTDDVTVTLCCHSREEKRREDNNNPPNPPRGGKKKRLRGTVEEKIDAILNGAKSS